MKSATEDTDVDTLARMSELYRRMTPAEKLRRVSSLTMATERLALAGLMSRHPGECEGQLRLRLARQRLGAELFALCFPHAPSPGE
ncbi:MAG: hypothetical protein R3E10_10400 [Gemmatimonadota bacterium]